MGPPTPAPPSDVTRTTIKHGMNDVPPPWPCRHIGNDDIHSVLPTVQQRSAAPSFFLPPRAVILPHPTRARCSVRGLSVFSAPTLLDCCKSLRPTDAADSLRP
eukprot:96320-Chlamydomonas_euryale.AAC.3